MAARKKKKAARRAAKAFKELKKLDPKSVVREGERRAVAREGEVLTGKLFRDFKEVHPRSVVREGERLTAKNRLPSGRKKKKKR